MVCPACGHSRGAFIRNFIHSFDALFGRCSVESAPTPEQRQLLAGMWLTTLGSVFVGDDLAGAAGIRREPLSRARGLPDTRTANSAGDAPPPSKKMSKSHLVLARVGRSSLHPSWTSDVRSRTWDLYLCPYQSLAPDAERDCTVGEVIAGPKWTGLREVLRRWDGWRKYEYIWLPDDDIFASQASINRMFDLAKGLSFDLCAPALHENSYYAHYVTMRNRGCFARRTGFVEIMVPCFRVSALSKLLPTLDLSSSGWGWGLDSLWPKLLGYRNTGIIDAVTVLHTRAVGAFRDEALGRQVRAESDQIMAEYDCGQVHTTFGAIGPNLDDENLTNEALTCRLAEGWRYLWSAEPTVLPWLVRAQQPSAGWNAYPIAGQPSCAVPGVLA